MEKYFREPVSGLTHLVGALFAFWGLSLMMSQSFIGDDFWVTLAVSLYCFSLIGMYLSSSVYHLLPLSPEGTRFLRRLDHMCIYLLIAGTYTPFCLITLKSTLGFKVFAFIWMVALLGCCLKVFWLHAPRWFGVLLYILMGWGGLWVIISMVGLLDPMGVKWIMAGGILYTLGAVVYVTKRPNPFPKVFGFHEIWHLFVMAASFCHFWSIYKYVCA